jgi:hypothetical protein
MAAIRTIPNPPKAAACANAHRVLLASRETCESFLSIFNQVRKDRGAKGASTDSEQDLLRAMLVFASSGLDAMMKQLIHDALPKVIEQGNVGAMEFFSNFVAREISRDAKAGAALISRSLTSTMPQRYLQDWYRGQLGAESLQSKDQIFQIAACFDIPSKDITGEPNALKDIYKIRNKIIHEMDIDLKGANRKRIPRKRDEIVAAVNELLEVAEKFLAQVDSRCK